MIQNIAKEYFLKISLSMISYCWYFSFWTFFYFKKLFPLHPFTSTMWRTKLTSFWRLKGSNYFPKHVDVFMFPLSEIPIDTIFMMLKIISQMTSPITRLFKFTFILNVVESWLLLRYCRVKNISPSLYLKHVWSGAIATGLWISNVYM